jgi:hypothetical protein
LALIERLKEELVTKKDEVEKDGSPLDEGKTKLITEGDSVNGGDTIQIDWRLPLLEYIRYPGKTTDKKIKQQALKHTSLDDDLYRRIIDGGGSGTGWSRGPWHCRGGQQQRGGDQAWHQHRLIGPL